LSFITTLGVVMAILDLVMATLEPVMVTLERVDITLELAIGFPYKNVKCRGAHGMPQAPFRWL
jgi:hypothetical protein